ncbi:MAG TPA: DUF4349 domain-containing protein [Rhodoglobus sp.]|nr:DUF4349 domain-containing protein [Rhodoglobus sp.]
MRRTIAFPAALLVAGLALAGCSAAPASDEAVPLPDSGVRFDDGTVTAPELVQGSAGGAESSEALDQAGRDIVTTGWVTIVVDEPMDAATDAVRITESAGGRVDGRSEYAPTGGDNGSATLTLRIPAERLTETLDELRELGDVREVSLNSNDVTMQTQDVQARITALRASIDRLLALVGTATDTEALIALETAISDRQAELESLEAQQRSLEDQVEMSTITLTLQSVAEAPVREPDTFLSGLIAGWNALLAFFGGLVVGFGVLLPWLVLAGLVAVAVLLIVRALRRKPTAPAAETPAPQTPGE